MSLSTSALRAAWAPACQKKGSVFLEAYAALDAVFKKHNYKPTGPDCGAYNCRKITGGTGYSLHSYGPGDAFTFWTGLRIATSLAVDINWQDNPYGRRLVTDMPRAMIDDILRIRTKNGKQVWRWGGDYSTNKDAMHFEIVCTPRDLATGIVPLGSPVNPASPGKWIGFRPGATDKSVHAKGGLDNEVSELQMRLKARGLYAGAIDGVYGPNSQKAVVAFKKQIIALQKMTKQKQWPNSDALVGQATIDMLRWWSI